jgi:transcriptional regulator with XRE-family HTH domain
VTRAQIRSGELSEFEKALCRVIRSEVEIDGRSPEQIATIAGTGKTTLRRMMAGVVVMRVDNIQRICQVIGVPFWALVKAAESEEEQPTLQEVTDVELQMMLTAVRATLGEPRAMHGSVNIYSAVKGFGVAEIWEGLVGRGLAIRGPSLFGVQGYRVTYAGCQAIRLSKAATKRALEHLPS